MASDKKWASIYLTDGSLIEGTVEEEMSYGVYMHVNGEKKKLQMFDWNSVTKIVYTEKDDNELDTE